MHLYENTPDTVCANSDTNCEKKRGILLVEFSEFWCKRTPVLFQLAKSRREIIKVTNHKLNFTTLKKFLSM